jgi:spore germination cell wall hydrolase CwlJ-like protein
MKRAPKLALALSAVLALANCSTATEAPPVARAATDSAVEPARVPSDSELACLAEAVYFEAGHTAEGKRAVAHVVVNRARDPRFPGSVCAVVRDGCQFSYRCERKSLTLSDADRRAAARRAAETALSGASDPTGGALFFHSARVAPGWFGTRKRVGEFGGNIFYR